MEYIIINHHNQVLNTKAKFKNIVKSVRPMKFDSRESAKKFREDNNLTPNYKIKPKHYIQKRVEQNA